MSDFEEYLAGVRVKPKERRYHVCACANAPHTHHIERSPCQCRCGRRSQDDGMLWYVGEDPDSPQAPCARDFGTENPK